MKKISLFLLLASATYMANSVFAQTFNEWKDPNVNQVNRLPMHSSFRPAEEKRVSLNGLWKFNWVENAYQRPEKFFSPSFDDRGWAEINVPGNWELQGYGDPQYLNIGYCWRNDFQNNPPFVPEKKNHVGSYRREIFIPSDWKGEEIIAHFGSATSNIYLWVNGNFAGYSEDSKLESEFDITKYIKPGGKNLIALQIFRWCDGTYLEDQDFWRLSGLARDNYLYTRPSKCRLDDVRVTPSLFNDYTDGTLKIDLKLKGYPDVELQLFDPNGKMATSKIYGKGKTVSTEMVVDNPLKWSAEDPQLYTLNILLSKNGRRIQSIPVKVGFRDVKIEKGQLLVNGKPIIIKGVDRHELDPDGGYVLSRKRMLDDLRVLKENNINAVRTSHYPNDVEWYDLCDSVGIYLVAEANLESHGMGYGAKTLANREDYTKAHLERNERNVARNFNHPSVIIWSMGNEGGDGENFRKVYEMIKDMDPSRPVQYERAGLNPWTDIFCPMYMSPERVAKYCSNPESYRPVIQCEYNHAMGNSGGNFKEYMDLTRRDSLNQGGFIWDFADQGLRKYDDKGRMIFTYGGDYNNYDASDNNFCNNGLVSPDRVPNPHMYEVRHQYQNIWASPVDLKNGEIEIYNENFFIGLENYFLQWHLLENGEVIESGFKDLVDIEPQGRRIVKLDYTVPHSDNELLLNLEFISRKEASLLPASYVVASNQLTITPYSFESPVLKVSTNQLTVDDTNTNQLIITAPKVHLEFSKKDGMLNKYVVDGTSYLKEGGKLSPNFWRAPTDNDYGANLQKKKCVWRNANLTLKKINHVLEGGGTVLVSAIYDMPEVGAELEMNYTVSPAGEILLTSALTPAGNVADVPDLVRFGIQMQIPSTMERSQYYGRGPVENYSDRNSSAFIGLYDQTTKEQYYPYIRPQETATKSDMRFWKQLDSSGKGLCVTSSAPFFASAIPYSIESLDNGDEKTQRHFAEVGQVDYQNLLIDSAHAGVAGNNSWGALPLEKYRVPFGKHKLQLLISPVR